MGKFATDLQKYKRYSDKNSWVLLLTQQGLWALFVYRTGNKIYQSTLPKFIKSFLLLFWVLWQKWIEILTGISIPYSVTIGPSFYIGHFGGIILNANTVIGADCNISQGVTIGVSGRGEKRGVPVIGDRVYMGANATIVGKITVGDDSVIGGNSLVVESVPEKSTVVGVPAVVINTNGSSDYIQ